MSRHLLRTCFVSLSLLGALAASACGSHADDGEDDPLGDLDDDAKADSLASPTMHGPIFFGTSVAERLRGGARFHGWGFALTDEAEVSFETFGIDAERSLDTVVYLYQRRGTTNRWTMVDKNDDNEGLATAFSRARTALAAGEYRVIVKGKKRTTKGDFRLEASCAGAGCPSEPCLFGDSKNATMDWLPRSYFTEDRAASIVLTPYNVGERSPRANLVRRALTVVTGEPIDTVAAAFHAAEDGFIRERHFTDASGATYWAISVGNERDGSHHSVVFASAVNLEPLVHFVERGQPGGFCKVRPPTCALGAYLGELEASGEFTREVEAIDRDSSLSAALAKQLMAAAVEFADLAQPDEIFASADAVEAWALRDGRDDATYDLVRLVDSAGDDWGAVFVAGSTERVAVIRDGSFELCTRFARAPR